MPTYSLPFGVPVTLVQNIAYALPSKACYLTTSIALEGSLDGTTWTAHPGGPGPTATLASAPFIRCPTGAAIVVCKAVG